ncbi:integrase [Cellulomonas sp. NTE-D12]|nr:integrase [Cellulomonas sp. NTE-D12]
MATGLTAEDAVRVGAAVDAATAANTRRVYASAWRGWQAWCTGRGVSSLPATAAGIASYLAERAEAGASASTLDVAVAAIRAVHLEHGLDDPTLDPRLALVRRGLRRTVGLAARRQSHPLSVAEVGRILRHIDRATPAGARDAALLLVGFASALRRSELAALSTADVEWRPTGVLLTIRKSKGDQDGRGQIVAVARGEHAETDPVAALHAWLQVRPAGSGPLFSRMRRGGHVTSEPLSGAAVARVLQGRAAGAGLSDLPISGHSLRSGHATAAAAAGVGVERIAAQTRHRHVDTLIHRYIRPVEALATTSSAGLGL